MSCEACHKIYERERKATPCLSCPKPLLDQRIQWVWDIFSCLMSQCRSAGMGNFAGFDYTALHFILIAKDIPHDMWGYVLEKVEYLAVIANNYWNKKQPG